VWKNLWIGCRPPTRNERNLEFTIREDGVAGPCPRGVVEPSRAPGEVARGLLVEPGSACCCIDVSG